MRTTYVSKSTTTNHVSQWELFLFGRSIPTLTPTNGHLLRELGSIVRCIGRRNYVCEANLVMYPWPPLCIGTPLFRSQIIGSNAHRRRLDLQMLMPISLNTSNGSIMPQFLSGRISGGRRFLYYALCLVGFSETVAKNCPYYGRKFPYYGTKFL